MRKVYRSDKILSMNLTVNGVPRKVSFLPTLNYLPGENGSKFETSDEVLQAALERRGGYGSTFWLDEDESDAGCCGAIGAAGQPCTAAGTAACADARGGAIGADGQPCTAAGGDAGGAGMETVKVTSLADAKAWLIDNKGWAPKSRVTKRGLLDAAEEYGVIFDISE